MCAPAFVPIGSLGRGLNTEWHRIGLGDTQAGCDEGRRLYLGAKDGGCQEVHQHTFEVRQAELGLRGRPLEDEVNGVDGGEEEDQQQSRPGYEAQDAQSDQGGLHGGFIVRL